MVVRRIGRKPADVRIERQSTLTGRSHRAPQYDAMHDTAPAGVLLPVAFAPVLAGDTIKASSLMARIVGAPITASMATDQCRGMWFESWLFYVRVGDMPSAETIRSLIVDPGAAGSIQWREEAMAAIWNSYFTDEGLDGSPSPAWQSQDNEMFNEQNFLAMPGTGWWDSVTKNSDLPDVSGAPDEWNEQWIRYQALRRAKLTQTTWEEYLAKSGVSVPPQMRVENDPEMKVPELLRWQREFAYPQPAGYSSGGEDVSEVFRVQWFIQQKLERARFCAEPGVLVNCIAVRPKMYREQDPDTFDPLELLDDAFGWLPNDMDTDPHSSLVNIPAAVIGDTVPGAEATLDVRDLYLYGDQAFSVSGTPEAINGVAPLTKGDRYPSSITSLVYAFDLRVKHRIASRIGTDTTQG